MATYNTCRVAALAISVTLIHVDPQQVGNWKLNAAKCRLNAAFPWRLRFQLIILCIWQLETVTSRKNWSEYET